MLPSNPLVSNKLSLGLYSMFLTQFECPWRVLILCFKFLASHRATVLSSEQVANIRWSRNLIGLTFHILIVPFSFPAIIKEESYEDRLTNLTQLTQSLWALSIACINFLHNGSNIKILFFSHAASRRDLQHWSNVRPSDPEISIDLAIDAQREKAFAVATDPSGEYSKLNTPPCLAAVRLSPWSHEVMGWIEE